MSNLDHIEPDGGGNIDPYGAPLAIPGYRVEKLINAGAMGEVYLAMQEMLERPVAIKVIAPSLSVDPTFRQRFLTEGKIVAQLRHPHIMTIHTIGECQNQYYMVMEYVDGGSLKERIQKGLPVAQAVKILQQIASALGYAHRQGFIHRDVKPANILFRDDDNAVLSDFGIAKARKDNVRLTETGLAVGTVRYMSPEQAEGKSLDGRSDLYSLGLVFFEMLAGGRPNRTLDGFVERLPPALSRYQGILDKLLALNPDERFTTAEELINALENLPGQEEDKTVLLPSVKAGGKAMRWFNPYVFGTALLLAVAVMAVTGYYFLWNRSVNNAIRVEVSYFYRPANQLNFRSLMDGEILHSGDHYQIRFKPEQNGYAYIFQIDSSGGIYRLFPFEGNDVARSDNINPVQAGVTYFIPTENEAFELDDQIGQEQIFFLAFKERNMGLENQYATLVEARQAQNQSKVAELQLQLADRLRKTKVSVLSTLNFKHNARGSHEL